MKNLILHVGLHKTASTSIQNELLHQFGTDSGGDSASTPFFYPEFTIGEKKYHNHSIPLYLKFKNPSASYFAALEKNIDSSASIQSIDSQLESLLEDDRNIILSGEDISVLPPEGMTALRDMIDAHDFKSRVIAYVREPYSFLCSAIQEVVKAGQPVDLLSGGYKNSASSIHKHVKDLRQVFQSVEFYSFEEALRHPQGPVGHFFKVIGAPLEENYIPHQQNVGISGISTRLINHINTRHPSAINGRINPKRRGNIRLQSKLGVDGNKFALLEKEYETSKTFLGYERIGIHQVTGLNYDDSKINLIDSLSITPSQLELLQTKLSRLPPHLGEAGQEFLDTLQVEDE